MGRARIPFTLTGHLSPAAQARALRRAHAQAESYRYIRRRPPPRIAALEREYQRWRRREQQKARREQQEGQHNLAVLAAALAEDARERRCG